MSPQNFVDRTIVDVSTLGVKLAQLALLEGLVAQVGNLESRLRSLRWCARAGRLRTLLPMVALDWA